MPSPTASVDQRRRFDCDFRCRELYFSQAQWSKNGRSNESARQRSCALIGVNPKGCFARRIFSAALSSPKEPAKPDKSPVSY
jgi:hypothetical protein